MPSIEARAELFCGFFIENELGVSLRFSFPFWQVHLLTKEKNRERFKKNEKSFLDLITADFASQVQQRFH